MRLRVPAGRPVRVLDVLEAVAPWCMAAEILLIEGDVEFRRRELAAAVFVAAAGEPLLVEEQREVGRLDGQTALSLALGLPPNDDDEEELPHGPNPGDVVEEGDEAFEGEVLFEVPDDAARAIVRLLEEGRPVVQRKRWLRQGWEALADADLVVVGTSGPGGREAAERLRNEVQAVGGDESLRREAAGPGRDWPRWSRVADLRDRRDEGTVKTVEAIKRRWRTAFD